ncbi:MFS transporter [Pandoraea sp. ISTKB]|uniref:MFS transporter n=1 Tax=Pandoraea sp. ISTKB TaxID=1586708 RepID=UPI0009F1B0CF|nr:MFS transporter [Pandoraea sp. ISTKB]
MNTRTGQAEVLRMSTTGAPPAVEAADLDRIVSKAGRRLMWFLVALYLVAILDRSNISFAALTMNSDLGLSPKAYGIGVGAMFFTYALFEVPSNLLLARIGARATLTRIAILWGIVTMLMACAVGPLSFWGLRALLGAAESGLFPGVMLFLSFWFPYAWRARYNAVFNLAVPIAYIVSGVVSGALLTLNGAWGLAGWQWLFILEGLPAVALGVIGAFYLTNRPSEAQWLTPVERQSLQAALDANPPSAKVVAPTSMLRALVNPVVLTMGLCNTLLFCGLTSAQIWLPQMLKTYHASYMTIGLLAAIPPLAGLLGMLALGRLSDRSQHRFLHASLAFVLSACGFALVAMSNSLATMLTGFTLASVGVLATQAIFWTIPQSFLHRSTSAGAIGAIGMMGSIGGTVMPMIVGELRAQTHSFTAGFTVVAIVCLVGSALIGVLRSMMTSQR